MTGLRCRIRTEGSNPDVMAEQSQYQKRKEIEGIYKSLDKGAKKQLLELLLEDWAQALPQKGKEQGVSGANGKWAKRLVWLQDHWGTEFETKGTTAIRRMPLSGVVELLTIYALSVADVKGSLEFGSFEMESELSDKVNTALTALKSASGEQVSISRDAFNELQRIKREFAEAGGEVRGEVSTKILSTLGELLASLPSIKSEKEVAKYQANHAAYESRKKRVKEGEMPSGFSS